jgi:hypothetical protein
LILKFLGVKLKDARVEVEKIIGRGSGFVAVEIPFTPRAKRCEYRRGIGFRVLWVLIEVEVVWSLN